MCCDGHLNGCAPCTQNQLECKTTDQATGEAIVRGYVHSLECQLQNFRMRNRELEYRLVSLGHDVKPYTDDDDPHLLPWHGSLKYRPTTIVLPPTTAEPTYFSDVPHSSPGEAVPQVDTSADQSLHREPASMSPENYSKRAEDSYIMLRPPPKAIPKFLRYRQHNNIVSRPRTRYRGGTPPTVVAPVRGVIKTVEFVFREAEKLLCWITDKQTGFTRLLRNSLRYNAEELEAAIKVREEEYGRELWFSLEDGKHHSFSFLWML